MVSFIKNALLLAFVGSAMLADRANAECDVIYVRRELRDLSSEEWRIFVDAVKQLMNDKKPSPYDNLAKQHIEHQSECHGTPIFLPWHRAFLKTFELELQSKVPGCVVPYWDWSADSQSPHNSEVLSEKYLGGNGSGKDNCVGDSPFRDYVPGTVDDGYPKCISRQYNNNGKINSFSSPEALANIVKNIESFDDFSNAIEGSPHGNVHNGLGYGFSSMSSPNDPTFFLHHAHVDKIWYDHQRYHENFKDFGKKASPSAELRPWGMTFQDVIDPSSSKMCYRYAEPVNAYKGQSSSGSGHNKRRRSPVPHNHDHKDDNKHTGEHDEHCDVTSLSNPHEIPEDWAKMNNLNITQLRENEKKQKETYEKLNSNPSYVSPCALWHRDDLMHKKVESGEVKEFYATVNGKKVTVPVTKGCKPEDAIARTKKTILDAGLKILTGNELVKHLTCAIGAGGVDALLNNISQTPLLKGLFGDKISDLVTKGVDVNNPLKYFGQGGSGITSIAENLIPNLSKDGKLPKLL